MTLESTPNWVMLVAGCLVVYALWYVAQPKPEFEIQFVAGHAQATHGKVTQAFLELVQEVALANHLVRGAVCGYAAGGMIRLTFSTEFPEVGRQQLRNWWIINGWKAVSAKRSIHCR